jgi:NCS1 family nucleobase:cation symporter-1
VLIADYWLVRRTNLQLEDLYLTDGEYPSWNWTAVGATVLGSLLAWSGLVVTALRPLYDYAWFVGFFASGAFYAAVTPAASRLRPAIQ